MTIVIDLHVRINMIVPDDLVPYWQQGIWINHADRAVPTDTNMNTEYLLPEYHMDSYRYTCTNNKDKKRKGIILISTDKSMTELFYVQMQMGTHIHTKE